MEDLIKEYSNDNIDSFLKEIRDDSIESSRYEKSCLFVSVNLINSFIKIHTSQLDLICSGEKPKRIPSFKYLDSYGIKFKRYFEICISISHHEYTFFEVDNEWRTAPLKFKIGESQFEVSPISNLMVLFTEPIYSDNNSAHYEFGRFASIKCSLGEGLNYQEEFCKALFYLNSYYLKSTGFYASLLRLELDFDDPLDIFYENDIEDIFQTVTRKRNLKRKNFKSIEPLNLYNDASSKLGEQRFLMLYRILEFFISRAIHRKIANLRYDSSKSEEYILDSISFRSEEQQLSNLMKESLTLNLKSKLKEFCYRNNLIESNNFNLVSIALYAYRNSLVHAKESEIARTNFPNPFENYEDINSWIFVVDEIARRCIKKYNEK